jgi:hypothetical protein
MEQDLANILAARSRAKSFQHAQTLVDSGPVALDSMDEPAEAEVDSKGVDPRIQGLLAAKSPSAGSGEDSDASQRKSSKQLYQGVKVSVTQRAPACGVDSIYTHRLCPHLCPPALPTALPIFCAHIRCQNARPRFTERQHFRRAWTQKVGKFR